MKLKFFIAIFILSFQSLSFAGNDSFRLLFTSSLNGKLEGCTCEKNPASGLAKRAFIINKYRKKFPKTILVDTGDNLADTYDPILLKYTIEGFSMLRYNAILFGDQDLYSGIKDFLEVQQKYNLPYLYSGISFSNRKNPFSKNVVNFNHGSGRITILAYSDGSAYKFFPSQNKKNLNFSNLKELQQRLKKIKKKNNYIILLSHSGLDIDKKIAKFPQAPDLIISGHDQTLFRKLYYIKKTAIVSNGMNGYYIGELVIRNQKIIKYRLIPTPYDKTPADPKIKKIVDNYLTEKKELFKF